MPELTMHNGRVIDADPTPERCPECGKPLDRIERRGDVVAFVHRGENTVSPACLR